MRSMFKAAKGVKIPQANLYEYAFSPVPCNRRKHAVPLFFVTTGYMVALSCFVIGAKVGYAMPFWPAVGACLLGNSILLGIGGIMGSIACQTGWSTSFLSRQVFGQRASAIFSICIILLSINWIGLNGDTFARMILSVFPGCPLPVPVLAVLAVATWALSAAYGWQGLELLSRIVVPLALGLAFLWVLLLGLKTQGFQCISTYHSLGTMTFTTATTAVIGNFMFACTVAPDICRFAKRKKEVWGIMLPAYLLGLFLFNVGGILVAQASGSSDFTVGVASLGLAIPALLCTVFCLWTTQDNNIYGGSLAVQNIFQGTAVEGNLSHRTVAYMISGLAAAFASLGALQYWIPIITLISVFVPPVPGMIMGEFFLVKHSKEHRTVNWLSLPPWVLGSLVGFFSLQEDFFLAPVIAMMVACGSYVLLSKALDPIINQKKKPPDLVQ